MSPLSRDPEARARQLANLRDAPPPAPAGNARARRHGGYAEVARERIEGRARELLDALSADAPLRDADGELPRPDAAIVHLLATALCRLEDVESHLTAHGYLTDDGGVRPAADLASRLRRETADYLDALGMTPRSRARLGLDLSRGFDLAREMAAEADRVPAESWRCDECGAENGYRYVNGQAIPLPPGWTDEDGEVRCFTCARAEAGR